MPEEINPDAPKSLAIWDEREAGVLKSLYSHRDLAFRPWEIGFPENVIDTALEPGVSSREGHHGLGLTIVNRLAQAHGWTVTISNEETGGARIEFTDVMISKSA